ncbi:MAG: HAMP domain-containing sensor histidine kinase [Phycisphaerae bacterium]
MADQDRTRLTAWTVAGISVVTITLVLAAFGMVLAIRQTQLLASQRINDLRPEARRVRAEINKQVASELEDTLENISVNWRSSLRLPPFGAKKPPSWVDEVYMFDSTSLIIIWRRTADDVWERTPRRSGKSEDGEQAQASIMARLFPPLLTAQFDSQSASVEFIHDVENGKPVVIAYATDLQGANGPTIVGARINVERFVADVVEPSISSEQFSQRITVDRDSEEAVNSHWSETLGPAVPFVELTPSKQLVRSQYKLVQRQTIYFIVGTVLVMTALTGVLWAMWRVFNRELALSRMKQSFVADVSHELKTPLALIRLFGETLLSGRVNSDDKRREYYEIITRESSRLTHLINNILDFARIDAGRKRYTMVECDVAALVTETYEAYQLQLDHEKFEHQLIIGEDLPLIQCDRDAVAQALINLINNAMKYSDGDDRFLGIDVSAETRRGGHGVLISVSDRGIGIKPEDRNHLFTDFYRANDDLVRARRGAGLGLALVKHIVDAHHGIVDVESRLVKGSTFRIFLPQASATTLMENNDASYSDRRG